MKSLPLWVVLLVGAISSLGFLLGASERAPRLLLVAMVAWVLAPYIALSWANGASKGWPEPHGATLRGVILVVTAASLAFYGANALWPRKSQAAFVFVAVPLASWALLAIVGLIAVFAARRSSSVRRGCLDNCFPQAVY